MFSSQVWAKQRRSEKNSSHVDCNRLEFHPSDLNPSVHLPVCKSTAEISVPSFNLTSRNVDSGLNFNPTEVSSKPPASFAYMYKTQTYG